MRKREYHDMEVGNLKKDLELIYLRIAVKGREMWGRANNPSHRLKNIHNSTEENDRIKRNILALRHKRIINIIEHIFYSAWLPLSPRQSWADALDALSTWNGKYLLLCSNASLPTRADSREILLPYLSREPNERFQLRFKLLLALDSLLRGPLALGCETLKSSYSGASKAVFSMWVCVIRWLICDMLYAWCSLRSSRVALWF